MRKIFLFLAFVIACLPQIKAMERLSGLPIPRFVSLRDEETNVRYGPGLDYPVKWVYTKKHMPLRVIDEYYHWRKLEDFTGGTGWVHGSLLSGNDYALVIADRAYADMLYAPKSDAKIIAKVGRRNVVRVNLCSVKYCDVEVKGYRGYVEKKYLWGSLIEE